ncbi:MAG: type 1 glutamine amidotransferase [Proteobacteria bacterium]|nr:type 1 glutamine amidotransferase [Pseudomonadota bacterium]
MTLRILVLEGNDVEGRHRQKSRLGRTASEGYSGCIRFLAPDAQIDICNAADDCDDVPDIGRLSSYDGVVITGSALHIWEGKPEALRQVALARKVFEAGVPFFGSCWGLQVASAAAGGIVEKNPMGREVGVARAITISAAGKEHPLLAGRPPVFSAPCIHLDAVTVPAPGTSILASNAMAPVQAAEIHHANGVFWGVQYHPEFTLAYLAKLLRLNLPLHVEEGCFRDLQQAEDYCSDLIDLCHNPGLFRHVVWRYGIGPELTDRSVRMTEIRNFIEYRVRPHAQMRLAA